MNRMVALAALVFALPLHAQTIAASEAAAHIGETATVCGTVKGIHYASSSKGQPTFIDLDRRYPNQDFTILIWGEDRAKFGDITLKYVEHAVCAHGVIKDYRGKPEMIISDPGELEAK